MTTAASKARAALERAIAQVGGQPALLKAIRLLHPKGACKLQTRDIAEWLASRVPAEFCPDIELAGGVPCEELRPDINWGILRAQRVQRPIDSPGEKQRSWTVTTTAQVSAPTAEEALALVVDGALSSTFFSRVLVEPTPGDS